MNALDHYIARAVARGCRVQARDECSAIVVQPRSYSPLGVILFSAFFVLAWLMFGETGCAVGVLPLALYALAYACSRDKTYKVSLVDGEVKVVRLG